ncbi:MAG: 8-oxo-dGTP diphosphatase [Spirochaetales bacterium]|nr:8-oxo-dGTP diphosphatase [Spirochaetales bacterium]
MDLFILVRFIFVAILFIAVVVRILLRVRYHAGKLQMRAVNLFIFAVIASLALQLSLDRFGDSSFFLLPMVGSFIVLLLLFSRNFKIFSIKCKECRSRRAVKDILSDQEGICAGCKAQGEVIESTSARLPSRLKFTSPFVDQIDWASWEPNMSAVLGFLVRGEEVILIHKKTGLGTGKVNAPGGKIEPGETPQEAVVREIKEEISLDMRNPVQVAELFFQFTDGLALHTVAFVCTEFEGQMQESFEATPFWARIDDLPFDKMWEDDQYWLPFFFQGKRLKAYFTFDSDRMLDKKIVLL